MNNNMLEKINEIEIKLSRIEDKINHMLGFFEELFIEYDNEEEEGEDQEEDMDEYDGGEGWISGLDSWKDDYNPDDEEI